MKMGGIIAGVLLLFQILFISGATCINGTVDFSDGICSLVMDGEEHTSLMLTSTGLTHKVTLTGGGECHLKLLLVGGGGNFGSYGGGGSGYIEYLQHQVSAGTVLTAWVGDQRQSSSVIISRGDTFTALPGYDGPDFDGGDGYCGGGGGGYYGGAGGTNGGDGYRDEGTGGIGTGGLGSRWDISGLTFNTWNLGAGAGARA